MDVPTLRIAFAVMAGVLVVLSFSAAYLPTRAPFSGWWTTALVLFLASSLAYLADGTPAQVVCNPLGSGLAVGGAEAAWCAARSLHARPPRRSALIIAPSAATLAGALDHPATNTWAGGLPYLLFMAAGFAGAAWETRRAAAALLTAASNTAGGAAGGAEAAARRKEAQGFHLQLGAVGFASSILAAYFTARTAGYVIFGPFSHTFVTWLGPGPTTVLLIIQLSSVSFSLSSLSTLQVVADLRRRAVYDQLTGLLRAQEFRHYAAALLPRLARDHQVAVVAMADLDHFKAINDHHGHAVGDKVLQAFGRAAQALVSPHGLGGRLGGEEFAFLFPARSLDQAEHLLSTLQAEFARTVPFTGERQPTLSIGVAPVTGDHDLAVLLDRADQALYRAKTSGRDRIVRG